MFKHQKPIYLKSILKLALMIKTMMTKYKNVNSKLCKIKITFVNGI